MEENQIIWEGDSLTMNPFHNSGEWKGWSAGEIWEANNAALIKRKTYTIVDFDDYFLVQNKKGDRTFTPQRVKTFIEAVAIVAEKCGAKMRLYQTRRRTK